MTPDEVRAIEADCARLINLYATLNDAGQWDEVAALYAEDGLMTRPTAPNDPIVGRAAILAAFRSRPARLTRHVGANIVVTVESAEVARATSTMLLFTGTADPEGGVARPDGTAPLVGGFSDRFVRTAEGWRFSERRGSLSFLPA